MSSQPMSDARVPSMAQRERDLQAKAEAEARHFELVAIVGEAIGELLFRRSRIALTESHCLTPLGIQPHDHDALFKLINAELVEAGETPVQVELSNGPVTIGDVARAIEAKLSEASS